MAGKADRGLALRPSLRQFAGMPGPSQPQSGAPDLAALKARLQDYAYWYLARFAASEARLVQLIERRARKLLGDMAAADDAGDLARRLKTLAAEIARSCVELGLVNDRLYGEARARRLIARGKSLNAIRAALAQKGISPTEIKAILGEVEAGCEDGDPDLDAARIYARRRRLGPYRRGRALAAQAEQDLRRRDFAALARAGFSAAVARRVLAAPPDEDDHHEPECDGEE